MEISIFTVIFGIIFLAALLWVLFKFAVNIAQSIIYVVLGLTGVYLLIRFYPNLVAWVNTWG